MQGLGHRGKISFFLMFVMQLQSLDSGGGKRWALSLHVFPKQAVMMDSTALC